MLIRPACVDDAAAIAQVAAGLGYKEETVEYSAVQRLERLLGSNDDRAWVVELDGVVIGWLHAQHAFEWLLQILLKYWDCLSRPKPVSKGLDVSWLNKLDGGHQKNM
jgi:hypothetical protein